MSSDQGVEQVLNEVLEYIVSKIQADFPFKNVEVKGDPELDEDDAMVGIVECDKVFYSFVIPNEDPRPILQKLYPIVIEEDG